MAFTVQNDSGTVADANAYVTVQYFKDYHDLRGNDYSGYSDAQIEIGIVKATDFVDIRFTYSGSPLEDNQGTQFPRDSSGIPKSVKEATVEYALRAMIGDLLPDPEYNGVGKVKSIDSSTGPIKDVVEYFENREDYEMPAYPFADRKLINSGYVMTGSVGFLTR